MTGRKAHQSNIKSIIAPVGVMAVLASSLAVAVPAQATNGADTVFGEWALSHYTQPSSDSTRPADPDGEAGRNNPNNVMKIGEIHTQSVTGTSEVEYSDWVTQEPAGEGWEQYDSRSATSYEQVLVKPAVPAVPGFWTNFQPNNINEPFVGPPSYPTDSRGSWSAPKTNGGPQQDASGVYPNGNPRKGGNWFYRSQGTPAIPAVYKTVEHQVTEFKYVRTVDTPDHTEYYWAVYERTNSPGDSDPSDPGNSGDPSTPSVPTEVKGQTAQTPSSAPNTSHASNASHQPAQSHAARQAVPLSIDAGL